MEWKAKLSLRGISENGDGQKCEIRSHWRKKPRYLECRVPPCAADRSVGAHLIAGAPRDSVDRTSDFQLAM